MQIRKKENGQKGAVDLALTCLFGMTGCTMYMGQTIDELIDEIRRSFPSFSSDSELARRSHEDWVNLRRDLSLLLPADVVRLLPFVMVDFAATREVWPQMYSEMVILFLDVLGPLRDPADEKTLSIISQFAAENLEPEKAEQLWRMMSFDPFASPGQTKAARAIEHRSSKEASFSGIGRAQANAICAFLRYMAEYEEFKAPGGGPTEFMENAMTYWRLRGLGILGRIEGT